MYHVIERHGEAVDLPLAANRDLDDAERFFHKTLQDQPLFAPDRIRADGAGLYPPAVTGSCKADLLPSTPKHYVIMHLRTHNFWLQGHDKLLISLGLAMASKCSPKNMQKGMVEAIPQMKVYFAKRS